MPLQAIDEKMECSIAQNVLKALLTPEQIEAEKSAAHPIALLVAVCGCTDKP